MRAGSFLIARPISSLRSSSSILFTGLGIRSFQNASFLGFHKSPKPRKKNLKKTLRSKKERKRTMRSERKRTEFPTLPFHAGRFFSLGIFKQSSALGYRWLLSSFTKWALVLLEQGRQQPGMTDVAGICCGIFVFGCPYAPHLALPCLKHLQVVEMVAI